MEFTAADIFQHSPFGDILNSLKHLSLSGEPWPDYGQDGWGTDDEEIQSQLRLKFEALRKRKVLPSYNGGAYRPLKHRKYIAKDE